jgi:hypothetical protein
MSFGDGLPDRRLSGQYDLYASQVRLGTGSSGQRGAGGRSDHTPEHLIVGIANPWAQHEKLLLRHR